MTLIRAGFTLALPALLFVASAVAAPVKNGFDLGAALVPAHLIEAGGPPRDGIPAIDDPKFVSPADARLSDDDRVLGLHRNGAARAYPIRILNWHEIVNDALRGERVAITYCPLCGSGVAYQADVAGLSLRFGVSGLLYNSDVLLYDRQTESLWSQILAQAIAGPLKGRRLQVIPLTHTTWGDWRARYSETQLLSEETGYRRDYSQDPYAGYASSSALYFSVAARDDRFDPKEFVIGLESAGRFKAYPFSELERADGEVRDTFAGREVIVRFDAENRTGAVYDLSGDVVPTITAYWFAWYAFHPNTDVYQANDDSR